MRIATWLILLVGLVGFPALIISQPNAAKIATAATFECISYYYPAALPGNAHIYHKSADEKNWHQGLDPIYDERDHEYRGSLVGLQPNSVYHLKLVLADEEVLAQACTLDEKIPIAKRTDRQAAQPRLSSANRGAPRDIIYIALLKVREPA